MAMSNRERVGRAFELLAAGLGPYVDRRMRIQSTAKDRWFEQVKARERGSVSLQDPALQLKVMADHWDVVFRNELTRSDRNVVFELRDVRNKWAHNEAFTADDAYRALDSIERLLVAVDAVEAADVGAGPRTNSCGRGTKRRRARPQRFRRSWLPPQQPGSSRGEM